MKIEVACMPGKFKNFTGKIHYKSYEASVKNACFSLNKTAPYISWIKGEVIESNFNVENFLETGLFTCPKFML